MLGLRIFFAVSTIPVRHEEILRAEAASRRKFTLLLSLLPARELVPGLKELAKYLVFTGRLISAKDALSIGLIDYVFEPAETDEKLNSLIAAGKLVPQKGKKTEDLPPEWRQIKELFADEHVGDWLAGKYLDSSDPVAAKTAKMIQSKAPLALRMANRIIDDGYKLPLAQGLKEELAHLNEIFSTADALTGLTSVGKGRPTFQGK